MQGVEPGTFYKHLGATLAARRRHKGMTQSELAERIGMPRARLANVETGRQTIHVHQLVEIATALGARSIEAILPANFWLSEGAPTSQSVTTTGSSLSADQKRTIAGIFESLSE